MYHKDIKAIIRKQLKTNYRDWKRLKKREKKEIAQKVLDKVLADYDFKKEVETDKLELLGIEQQKFTSGMMDLNEMARFLESHEDDVLFKLNQKRRNSSNLKDKELIYGWIEQTIADEGHVKHYPETYRREIVWRRSFNKNLNKYRLNIDERKMLDKIGIRYDLKNIGTYKTKKGIEKIRLQMRLAKRKNLLKLRKLVIIPDRKKDETFTEITQGFVRYKEPLKIKSMIIKVCEENGFITSPLLKNAMNYKRVNTSVKWIKFYLNRGLLKCIKNASYGNGIVGKIPAYYVVNKP